MKILTALGFILVSQLAGIIGAFFTSSAISSWYVTLNKPAFNPPGWLFGPVWVILYTLMGIAAYLVWQRWGESNLAKWAVILFLVHLAFNALWSILFFGLKNPMFAFFEIIFLLIMIVSVSIMFLQIDKRAFFMMLPYIIWVSFAMVLNFYIWRLNM